MPLKQGRTPIHAVTERDRKKAVSLCNTYIKDGHNRADIARLVPCQRTEISSLMNNKKVRSYVVVGVIKKLGK